MPKWMPTGLDVLVAVSFPVIKFLPVKTASVLLASVFSRVSWLFLKQRKFRGNLRAALPDLDERTLDDTIKRMAANFGRYVAEVVHISKFKNGAQGTSITCVASDGSPFECRGPAIYIGAHLGSWELVPIVLQRNSNPVTIIYSLVDIPLIDRLFLSLRRKTGASYVEKSEALRACMKAMQRGESVALLVDQRVESGIEVDFFGRMSVFTPLPARLALRFNCPIIPCEAVRVSPGQIQVNFHAPILPSPERGKDAEIELTQKMANAIEDAISRNPDTWFCNKRRWKKQRPPATPENGQNREEMAIQS